MIARPFFAILCSAATVAASLILSGGAQSRELAAEDIREKIAGKRIFLAVPLGGEFPLFYRKDGRVDGSGEAVGLGRLARPTDSGRWWIAGNRLCQRWQTWYNGQQMCFQLVSLGGDRLRWTQDNGDTGIARIGN
ncbi:MAG: hypothetical protein MUC44_12410 [Beijerinckiaceae bacterium]|jgi:hypothetical protein|nr:hypothetical protein [Beijerinckiaceae bacterium]